jgi:RHS repeat-associated protein
MNGRKSLQSNIHAPFFAPQAEPALRAASDGDGVRRKRLDDSGTIHYVVAFQRNVGNGRESTTETITKTYAALGRLIAFRKDGVLHWVGTDHLGSTIRTTDSSFTAIDQQRYHPFGAKRAVALGGGVSEGDNLGVDHRYTGQIDDASMGLYWYNSRAYDATIGRFVQPDSIVPEPDDPQSLNRYS